MKNNSKMPWLKIIVWGAIGIHLILIILSIIEVAVYSLIINPGKEESFYNEHAQTTAPYVSIIFGIIIFYSVAKSISKNKLQVWKKIGVWLALVYIITDLGILYFSNINWSEMYLVVILSAITKFISSYFGAMSGGKRHIQNLKD